MKTLLILYEETDVITKFTPKKLRQLTYTDFGMKGLG
jgi:hypothetical protein